MALPSQSKYKVKYSNPLVIDDAINLVPFHNVVENFEFPNLLDGPGRAVLILSTEAKKQINRLFENVEPLDGNKKIPSNVGYYEADGKVKELQGDPSDSLSVLGTSITNPFGFNCNDLFIKNDNGTISYEIKPDQKFKSRKSALTGVFDFSTAEIYAERMNNIVINPIMGLGYAIKEYVNTEDIQFQIRFMVVNQVENTLPLDQIKALTQVFEVGRRKAIAINCPYIKNLGVNKLVIKSISWNQIPVANMVECAMTCISESVIKTNINNSK